MAHDWDPYYHNPPSLSSDPVTLSGTSDTNRTVSQNLERFPGHNDYSNPLGSHEAPVENSDYHSSYCPNKSTANTSSDCVYQRFCNETQWQTGEEQLGKDYLQRCATSDLTDFDTDGLQTSELQDLPEFKQDCGMLPTSFLENYSDVSSSSDTGETRPSCDYHGDNLLAEPKANVLTEHSSSDWLSPHAGSMDLANVNPSLSSSEIFPSKENEVFCMQDLMESPEKVVEPYAGQKSDTSYMTGDKNNSLHAQNEFCLTQDGLEGDFSHQCSDSSVMNHGNKNVIDRIDGYPDECEKITSSGETISPPDKDDHVDHKVLQNKSSRGNCELERSNYSESKVSIMTDEKQAKSEVLMDHLSSATSSLSSDDTIWKVDKCNTNNLNNIAEVELSSQLPKCPSDTSQDNAGNGLTRAEVSQVSDAVDESPTEFFKAKTVTTDSHLDPQKEVDSLTILSKSSHSANSNDTCDRSCKENTGGTTTTLCKSVETLSPLDISNIKANSELDQEKSGDAVRTSTMQLDNPDRSVNVSSSEKTNEEKTNCSRSSIENEAHMDVCQEQEQNTEVSVPYWDYNGSNALRTDSAVNASDESSTKGTLLPGSSQQKIAEREKHPFEETRIQTPSKSPTTSLESPVDEKVAVTSDNDENVLSNLKSCPQLNESSKDMNPSSEMEWKSSYSDQQLPHKSLIPKELPRPLEDTAETPREAFEEMDLPIKDASVPTILYGEPLSGEDSSSESDDAKLILNRCKNTSVDRFHPERQELPPKSLKGSLYPIVKLLPIETTSDETDSYQCGKCNHKTSTVDLLIEHHQHQHSHPMDDFQFSETSNLCQMSDEQTANNLCAVTTVNTEISSNLKQKKKTSAFSRCIKCGLRFKRVQNYISHMRIHTGKTPYKCHQCGMYFSQSCSLNRHKRVPGRCKMPQHSVSGSDANVGDIKTPPLPQNNTTQGDQYINMRNCYVRLIDFAKTSHCGICEKSFRSVAKAKKHRRTIHKMSVSILLKQFSPNVLKEVKKKLKCPLCPSHFKYSFNRARHLRNCVREAVYGGKIKVNGNFSCPLCKATFTLTRNRYRHINKTCLPEFINRLAKKKEHLKQTMKCQDPHDIKQEIQPKKTAKTKLKQIEHQLSTPSQPEPRFKCNLCPAVFDHYSSKYRHMKKHELFKLSGKKVKYRRSLASFISKSEMLSSKKTDHSAKKMTKEDNLKSTDTKENYLKLTQTKPDNLKSSETNGDHALDCPVCGKRFDSSISLKKHSCKDCGERPYRCLECGKGFKRQSHLLGHRNVHQRRIQCTVCKKILPTIGELLKHRNVHNKKGMLKCPDCNLQFQYPAHLLKHLPTHKKKVNEVPQPEETTKPKPQQNLELTKEQSVSTHLQCSLCKEEFDDAQVLRKHSLTHISGASSSQCPFCQRKFGSRKYLLRHMIKHTGDKAFSCTHCGKQFYRLVSLEIHLEKCHPTSRSPPANIPMRKKHKFVCSFCSRPFFRKLRFKMHLHGHKTKSLLPCQFCGQCFRVNKIKQHQNECAESAKHNASSSLSPDRTSPKISSENCQDVDKQSVLPSTKTLLPFKCPHCIRKFRFRSVFLRHLVKHTGVQPYKCKHCDERFSSISSCLKHEAFCDDINEKGLSPSKSETFEKEPNISTVEEDVSQIPKADDVSELRCKFCTKTFVKPRSLRRHILTHNEVKPYRCKACDCCFSRYDHLTVHQARCKGRKRRLEVCIPKVSLEDVGKGWQVRFGAEPSEKKSMSDSVFSCEVCLKSFSNTSQLSRHTTLFHSPKIYKCATCGSAFSHEKSLKKHQKIKRCKNIISESGTSPPETNLQIENASGQLDGIRNRILARIQPFLNKKHRFTCSYCPRGFGSRAHLDVHIRLHTGERPFSCNDCGQRFIRKDYLQRHLSKCTQRKKSSMIPCNGCGGLFSSRTLENHTKNCKSMSESAAAAAAADEQTKQLPTDSPPKGFSCSCCKSRFLLFSQLQEHFLTSHNSESVEPPLSTAPLQQHLSTLPKIQLEVAIKRCDEGITVDPNLKTELESPPDSEVAKPFFCVNCNVSFVSKAGLVGHLRSHKSKQPFNCKICNKGFWNKTLCRNHYRKCRNGHGTPRQSEGPLKAKLDSVLVFKERSKRTGTGVLQTNFSCKDSTDEPQLNSDDNKEQSSSSNETKAVQYQCSECDQSFTDGLMLISHLEDHGRQEQEKKRNTCTRCGRICSNQAKLEKHMKMHGVPKNHSCPQCSKMFFTVSELEDHMTCHDPSRPYCCKLCYLRFWTRQTLCNHYREEHKDDVFNCQFCSKSYATKKSLARHYKDFHRKEPKGLGNTEGKGNEQRQADTSGESDKEANMDTEDSDSDSAPYFPCHVCGKTFKTSESLEDHQLCHLGKKPHECEECGRCFYQASQLQQHQRMHQSEFQCQICGKGCVSLFALRKHKHTHGKSHPFPCSKCHLSFRGSSQLTEHMATHREDNFPCDICDRVFQSKSSRVEHRKTHTNFSYHPAPSVSTKEQDQPNAVPEMSLEYSSELKYRCGVCHERFRDPEELSEHGCIKAKERPYSCLDCDKHFLHTSHLNNHRATHLPSWTKSEYTCNQCKISFSASADFLNHLKNHVAIVDEIKCESDEEDVGPSPTFICPVCLQCFQNATELIYHFPIHSEVNDKCEEKTALGGTVKEPENHSLTIDGAIECPSCFQTFWGVNALRQHLCPDQPQATVKEDFLNQSGPAYYKSTGDEEQVDVTRDDLDRPTCTTGFTTKHSHVEHQSLNHPIEKPFSCDVCGKTFAQKRYLARHKARQKCSHSQTSDALQLFPKDFKCLQCDKSFSTPQNLSIHMRMHAQRDAGDFRCDMCYKSFSLWVLLRQHQESHVGEVVYECTECDKAFAFPHLLEEHQQTHAGSSQ